MTCPIPDIFFGGARGGGKTDGILGHWLKHSNTYGDKARGILLRKSTPELEEVQRRADEIYSPLGATFRSPNQKINWKMPGGGLLKLRFLENDRDASKYQGHSYNWAGFDELGNWATPDPIDKIRATLRDANGIPCRIVASGNPGGIGHEWIKERYIKDHKPFVPFYDKEKETWRVFIPSRLSDNKLLIDNDPGYINRLKSSGPSWLVKAWLEGDWDSYQEGPIFKRDYWKYYREVPQLYFILQSWDTAFKTKRENDYSVCTTWGVADNGFYLLDRWKQKVEFPELKRSFVQLANKWSPNLILIEDKASGISLYQELNRETTFALKPIKVDIDKVARANAVVSSIEAGKVFLPDNQDWVLDYVDTLAAFPNAVHDDDVDSTTQALSELILFHKPPAYQLNYNLTR